MLRIRSKLTGVAVISMAVLCSAPAFAGFDEAHSWSFFSNQQIAPATPSSSNAQAEFQGDGFTTLRKNSHQYLDCISGKGGRLSCKKM